MKEHTRSKAAYNTSVVNKNAAKSHFQGRGSGRKVPAAIFNHVQQFNEANIQLVQPFAQWIVTYLKSWIIGL